jgi:hypothetical protein
MSVRAFHFMHYGSMNTHPLLQIKRRGAGARQIPRRPQQWTNALVSRLVHQGKLRLLPKGVYADGFDEYVSVGWELLTRCDKHQGVVHFQWDDVWKRDEGDYRQYIVDHVAADLQAKEVPIP